MNEEQVRQLEWAFRRYQLKKAARFLGAFVLVAGVGVVGFAGFKYVENGDFTGILNSAQSKKELAEREKAERELKMVQKEKEEILRRLEIAKIAAQKSRALAQKQGKSKQKPEKLLANDAAKAQKFTIKIYEASAKDLKKSFYQKPGIDKALQLANLHFAGKDYEKAMFWALKANELDKGSQESWLIFSKAKFAKGDKQGARKALQSFIDNYGGNVPESYEYILQ